jgi:hypothetical protein
MVREFILEPFCLFGYRYLSIAEEFGNKDINISSMDNIIFRVLYKLE